MPHLPRQTVLSLALTFAMGFLTGGYLYLGGFTSTFALPEVPPAAEVNEFVIEGRQYGGFRLAEPPSFQLLRDGSFRYIPPADTVAEAVVEEGVLPLALMSAVRAALDERTLARASRRVEPEFCESYVDGSDFAYEIRYNGTRYTLDTCGTDFSNDSALGEALVKLWEYFAMRE